MKLFETEITTKKKARLTRYGKKTLMGLALIALGVFTTIYFGSEDATAGVCLTGLGIAVISVKSLE